MIGAELEKAEKVCLDVLNGNKKEGAIPKYWDGKAAERITKSIVCKL